MFNRKACCSDLLSSLRGLLVRSSVIFFQSAFSSVQSLVVSDSLQPHEPQHSRPPCPSPTPEVHPNPCSLSR